MGGLHAACRRHEVLAVYLFGSRAGDGLDRLAAAAEKGIVADPGLAERFVQFAGFRNRLTHHYDCITPGELFEVLLRDLGDQPR